MSGSGSAATKTSWCMRIAAPEVQLALNRVEKSFTYSGALLYALASALPLVFVVVHRYRFLPGCCRGISTTSSREEVACSFRVATDEREPKGGAHIEIEWASCARPSGLHEGGGFRGLVGNGRRQVANGVVLSSGRVGSGRVGSGPGGMGRG